MLKSFRLGLRSISRRLSHARARLSRGRWIIHHTRSNQPECNPSVVQTPRVEQLALFTDIVTYEMKPKFKRRKPKGKSRAKKAIQYKMALRVKATDRKIRFRHRPTEYVDPTANRFTEPRVRKLHWVLLRESLMELRNCAEMRSGRVAEILQWFLRTDCNEPFSFETCLSIAGEFDEEYRGADPDVFRRSLKRELEDHYGGIPPHRDLLRHAIIDSDYGDSDAVAWMKSSSTADLSFDDCCESMGFSAIEARRQLFGDEATQEVTDDAISAAA